MWILANYKEPWVQLVKQFHGHSGCIVELYRNKDAYVVKKTGSAKLSSSAEILNCLRTLGFATPKILEVDCNTITMQYINGVDMKNYIAHADIDQINQLLEFINCYIKKFVNSPLTDISVAIKNKLDHIKLSCDLSALQIDTELLYDKLPKCVPVSKIIHGDFTLDNIIYYQDDFYLIDANPTNISSVYYDAGKLFQDLDCGWFIRHETNSTNYKVACSYISQQLKKRWQFLNNHYILIFMLMRILPYATDAKNREFLIKEINRLWQL